MVEWKKLGEVVFYFRGVTYNKKQEVSLNSGGTKILRANNITLENNSINYDDVKEIDSSVKIRNDQWLYSNDILICAGSGSKEHVGKVAFVNKELGYAYGGFMGKIVTKQNLKSRYLYHILCGSLFKDYLKIALNSTTINNLNAEIINSFLIPIPSLEEQTRIVGILDTFTSAIDNLKEQIVQRRKQYDYYRDQLLDLEGKEGVEMKYLLDVLAQPVTDGPHETPSFYEDGIPFISADAIVDNKINFSRKRGYISEEYDLLCQKKYKPQLNDIYLVKSGSTTGKVAIVRTDERFNIWSPLAAIRVNQRNHPYFVYYMLQTKKVQDQVKLKSSQGSQPNLSMRVLEKFIIPVPPLSEQQRIVSVLDTFEASIHNLEAQLAERQKQYEYYRNKLLTFE